MNRIYAYTAGSLVLAMLGGLAIFVLINGSARQTSCSQATVAGNARIGGAFELVDETGRTVTDMQVITKPSLVYFGYTYCPDICPIDATRNAEAVDLLQAQGYDVQPVFITIDPARDTPDVLAEYTELMHPDMIGLTGSPEQIKAVSQAYKTYYRKAGEDEYYLMDHSTFTYLMTPDKGFLEFFRRDITARQVAETTACFMDE